MPFRPPLGLHPRGKLRILIADDESINRRLLQMMLTSHGTCTGVANGEEALALWEEAWHHNRPFHLACLDIIMPGLDGKAVLAAIRAWESAHRVPSTKTTRVIIVSSLNDGGTVMDAFRKQCEAYLIKPIDPDDLENRLRVMGLVGPGRETTTALHRR
jgi:two-component system chemotaxis response regulator CheY